MFAICKMVARYRLFRSAAMMAAVALPVGLLAACASEPEPAPAPVQAAPPAPAPAPAPAPVPPARG